MNTMPEDIINNIVDYVVCGCGWTKNHDESHARFSNKECSKIDWDYEKCESCDEDITAENSYVDYNIRCKTCHLENMGDYCYGARDKTYTDFEMAGGSIHWWKYRVYFDEDGDQEKCCKLSAHGEEDLNDTLCINYEVPDRLILKSEIPEELMEEFNEVIKYN
jgi:hypothetical protein